MQTGQTKYGAGMTAAACLWLGLFPLLNFGSYSTITQDKWLCMVILTGVTLLCFLFDAFRGALSRPRPLSLAAGFLLLFWMVLSCLLGPYGPEAWWRGAGRMEGLSTQLCYLLLFFLFACSHVRRLPVLFSAGSGLLAFLAVILLQRAGFNPFGLYPGEYSLRIVPDFQGTIGNVDMDTGYLLVLSGLFLSPLRKILRQLPGAFREGRRSACRLLLRALPLLLLLSACVFLMSTFSVRFGLLVFSVLLVLFLVSFLPKKVRLPVLLVLAAAVLFLVWLLPCQSSSLHELHEVLRGRPDPTFGSHRLGLWDYCLKMLRQEGRLLFGTGADTFALRFRSFLSSWFEAHPDAWRISEYFDSPHCEYLALVIHFGIPGLLLFLLLLFRALSSDTPWRGGVLAYALQAALSFSVCLVAPLFWVLLGMSHGDGSH